MILRTNTIIVCATGWNLTFQPAFLYNALLARQVAALYHRTLDLQLAPAPFQWLIYFLCPSLPHYLSFISNAYPYSDRLDNDGRNRYDNCEPLVHTHVRMYLR
jgi:hypothetical protein